MEGVVIVHVNTHSQNMQCWVAVLGDECVGHVFLREEPDGSVKLMDAWVHDDHRRKGIYRALWEKRWEYAKANYRGRKVFAWCLETSLPLAVEKGLEVGQNCTYVHTVI